ncbi:MAG: PAS domain S-box protein [Anaerolineaceae bacterium]|nr:PAS domain S-box protein [Anaerolineaceae bacterium]
MYQLLIKFSISSWFADNQQYYTGIIRDITERKETEKALKKTQRTFGRSCQ